MLYYSTESYGPSGPNKVLSGREGTSVETLRICPTGMKETVTETETGAYSLLGSESEVFAKESFRASILGRTIGCRFFVAGPGNVCTRAPTDLSVLT